MAKQKKENTEHAAKLRIIPLGGLEQIGMNITAFEYEDSIVVVDCGLAFPEDDMYGIDLVIPDVTYLEENIDKVKSIESNVIKQLRYGKSDQLLKEMLASTAVEEETDAFYDTFDSTFLAMFPDFVDQFNNLLEEPARIILKKDEKLNTELRIYALVRLGIEDSNTIAGLLKYSVRTIYNYKVKLRNAARIPREEFDEMVRKIG